MDGKAVSELINWPDKRSDRIVEDGMSYCDKIYKLIGKRIAAGFGLATHYYNNCLGVLPDGAVSFCRIMDLLALCLTGLSFAFPWRQASVF